MFRGRIKDKEREESRWFRDEQTREKWEEDTEMRWLPVLVSLFKPLKYFGIEEIPSPPIPQRI